MTEEEARAYIRSRFGVSRETLIERFVGLLVAATKDQNLISAASIDSIWSRHVADSAQLIPLAPAAGAWIDVGSGAGLPGLIVAMLRDEETVLIEPRRRRVDFLEECVTALGLRRVRVIPSKVEATGGGASVISARAVASLPVLFEGARQWADHGTTWVLPRGRNGHEELADARRSWQGEFHVEQSMTSSDSVIIVARKVRRK